MNQAALPEANAKRPRAGLVVAALGAAVLGVFLFLRWRELGFQWDEFAATFRNLHWSWVAAGGVLALLTYVGRALRWRVLLAPVRRAPSLWNLLSATAIGFTAIVLFGRAGELVRPYLISLKEEVPFSTQVAAWLVERIYDLLTALLLFGIALSRIHNSGVDVGPRLEWVLRSGGYAAGAVAAGALTVLVGFGRFGGHMRRRLLDALSFLPDRLLQKAEAAVSSFATATECTGRWGVVVQLVLYSLLEWALIIACYLCLLHAVPATAAFRLTDVIILVGFTAFGAAIQVPGIGGGTQVVIVIILTELYRIQLEASSSIAILIWIITFVVIVPIGFLLAFHDGLNWRKLSRIRSEANR